MCAKAQRLSCLKSGKSGGSQWHSVHNRVLVWCGFGTCRGDERAGPPPPAAWPGAVPTSWCHHRLAKGTQPSAGCRLLQNWLLHQPLEPKALTNTGSLKIGFFSHVVGALSLPVQWGLQEGLKKYTKRGEKKLYQKLYWCLRPAETDPQSGGSDVGANCFTDDPFDTSCLIYISSLMEEETAAAAQPWLGALSGAEVGVGALGRPSPHLALSGCLGGQRGQGQRG